MSNTNAVAGQHAPVDTAHLWLGISYEASTVGIAACVQQFAMGPQDAMQAVARARSADRRIMLSPVSAPMAKIGTGRTSPDEVSRARFKSIDPKMQELYREHLSGVDPATVRYSVALEARVNYEAVNNQHVLACRLKDQGYMLRPFDELVSDNAVVIPKAERYRQTREAELSRRTQLIHEVMTGQKNIDQASSEAHQGDPGRHLGGPGSLTPAMPMSGFCASGRRPWLQQAHSPSRALSSARWQQRCRASTSTRHESYETSSVAASPSRTRRRSPRDVRQGAAQGGWVHHSEEAGSARRRPHLPLRRGHDRGCPDFVVGAIGLYSPRQKRDISPWFRQCLYFETTGSPSLQ